MPKVREAFDQTVVGVVTLDQVVGRIPVGSRMGNGPSQTQYDKGIKYAGEMDYATIGINNVWGGKAGLAAISSCERIGYHAGSADLILGMLAGGCPVFVAWTDCDGLYEWRRVAL